VSIFIAVQNYTAQGNEGIPKAIRSNMNCCAIWKSGNMKEIDLLTRAKCTFGWSGVPGGLGFRV
jgi:hypothetical protein